jgi:hypothetical protein
MALGMVDHGRRRLRRRDRVLLPGRYTMNTTPITPEVTADFWSFMECAFGVKTVKKSSSKLMAIARIFAGFNKADWQRASTIIGHTLFTDMEPGNPSNDVSLLGQMCLITHECQHVVQYENDRWYSLKYLLSKTYRAQIEAEAYTCNMEIHFLLTGKLIPVNAILNRLSKYKIGREGERVASLILWGAARDITRTGGRMLSEASQKAQSFFQRVRLKSRGAFLTASPITQFGRELC